MDIKFLILSLIIVLINVNISKQAGQLNTDVVYPASTEQVNIELLQGDQALVSDLNTDTLQFVSHPELNVRAPGIFLEGSFMESVSTNDATVQIAEGDIQIAAAHAFNANGNTIDISSGTGSIAIDTPRGNTLISAEDTIELEAGNIDLNARTGGIKIRSEGGDIMVNAGDDIESTSGGRADINVEETFSIQSLNEINLDGEDDATFDVLNTIFFDSVSQTNMFALDDIEWETAGVMTVGSRNQIDITSEQDDIFIQSVTDNVNFFAYETASLSSATTLDIIGRSTGVAIQGKGSRSNVNIQTNTGNILMQANGNTESSGIQVSSLTTELTGKNNLSWSSEAIEIDASNELLVTSNSGTTITATENVEYNSEKITFEGSGSGKLESSVGYIELNSNMEAANGIGNGYIDVSANKVINVDIQNQLDYEGSEVSFSSTSGDISMTANNGINLYAKNGFGLNQSIDISTNKFTVISNTGTYSGGEINIGNFGVPISNLAVTIEMDHTFLGDLDIELTSPSGTKIILFNQNCGSLNDISETFVDGGGDICNDENPAAPVDPLALLIGESSVGPWTLEITDFLSGDQGVLNSWSLHFTGTLTESFESLTNIVFDDNAVDEIVVDMNGNIEDITVNVQLSHTFLGDVEMSLQSPSGTFVRLMDNQCGTLDDYFGTFQDGGGDICNDENPAAPVDPLSNFHGEPASGTWTLVIDDTFPYDIGGVFLGWQLNIQTDGFGSGIATSSPSLPIDDSIGTTRDTLVVGSAGSIFSMNSGTDINFGANYLERDSIKFESLRAGSLSSTQKTLVNPSGQLNMNAESGTVMLKSVSDVFFKDTNTNFAKNIDINARDQVSFSGPRILSTSTQDQEMHSSQQITLKSTNQAVSLGPNVEEVNIYGEYMTIGGNSGDFDATNYGGILSNNRISINANNGLLVNNKDNLNELQIVSDGPIRVSSANDIGFNSNQFRLESDEREMIEIESNTKNILLESQNLDLLGDEVNFESVGAKIDYSGVNSEIKVHERGLFINAENILTFDGANTNTQMNMYAAGSMNMLSLDGDFTETGNLLTIYSSNELDIFGSGSGGVSFVSTSDLSITSNNNNMFHSGSATGDLISLISGTTMDFLTFDGDIDFNISEGFTKFSSSTTTTFRSVDINMISNYNDINIQADTRHESVITGRNLINGGDIDFDATTNYSVLSNSDLFIYSVDKMLTEQMLTTDYVIDGTINNQDDMNFIATNNINLESSGNSFNLYGDNSLNLYTNRNLDDTDEDALANQNAGDITFKSTKLLIENSGDNYDISMISNGEFTFLSKSNLFPVHLEANSNMFVEANGNLNVTNGQNINYESIDGSLSIDSKKGCFVTEVHSGVINDISFVTGRNGFDDSSDIDIWSYDQLTYESSSSIEMTSNGYDDSRRNQDGNTINADYFEYAGLSLVSEHEEGAIYFFSDLANKLNSFTFTSQEELIVESLNADINVETFDDIVLTSNQDFINLYSNDGTMELRGSFGVNIDTDNWYISASNNIDLLAEEQISFTSGNNIDITGESGHIFINTDRQKDIDYFAEENIFINGGGDGINFTAQGGIHATITGTVSIESEFGSEFVTSNGPITFESGTDRINFEAYNDITFLSGNDMILDGNNQVTFNTFKDGIHVSTELDDINISAVNNIDYTSINDDPSRMLIQSEGTANQNDDRVLFKAENLFNIASTNSMYIDATETFTVGATTLPVVEITSGGNTAYPGFTLTSGGNSEFTTTSGIFQAIADEDIVMNSNSETQFVSNQATTFTTTGTIDITGEKGTLKVFTPSDDIDFLSLQGTTLSSGEIIRFDSTSRDVTNGISITVDDNIFIDSPIVVNDVTQNFDFTVPLGTISIEGDAFIHFDNDRANNNGAITLTHQTSGDSNFVSGGIQTYTASNSNALFSFINPDLVADISFQTNGQDSDILFSTNNAFDATEVDSLFTFTTVNGNDINVSTLDPNSGFSLTSTDGNIAFSNNLGEDPITVTSNTETIDILPVDEYSGIGNSIHVTGSVLNFSGPFTTFTYDASDLVFETFNGDISFSDIPNFTIDTNTGPQNDITFSTLNPGRLTNDATNDDISITTLALDVDSPQLLIQAEGEYDSITISPSNQLSISATDVEFFAGYQNNNQETSSATFKASSADTLTLQATTDLSILTDNENNRNRNGNNQFTITNSNVITSPDFAVAANSIEPNSGFNKFTASQATTFTATNNILLQSPNVYHEFVDGSITYNAASMDFLLENHGGATSYAIFETTENGSVQFSATVSSTILSVQSTKFLAYDENSNGVGGTLDINIQNSVSFIFDDDAGSTDNDVLIIQSPDIQISAGNNFNFATENQIITANEIDFTSSDEIDITSQNIFFHSSSSRDMVINRTGDDEHVGIRIDIGDTITALSASNLNAVNYKSGGDLLFDSPIINLEAEDDLEIDARQEVIFETDGSFNFDPAYDFDITSARDIYLYNFDGGIDITGASNIFIHVFDDDNQIPSEEESVFEIDTDLLSMEALVGDLDIQTNGNWIIESRESISLEAEGSMTFTGETGGFLFRSLSEVFLSTIFADAEDIIIQAFDEVRHIHTTLSFFGVAESGQINYPTAASHDPFTDNCEADCFIIAVDACNNWNCFEQQQRAFDLYSALSRYGLLFHPSFTRYPHVP
eukprot:TRINITY_DN1036_c2_g1_i2.p1 TRINITY_DN1036_c2_g1~~TRINITY_DN1036_c2_g1_i2.p1  ORF type:complete len:2659 (+),score=1056.81 TRINITY_DN1036_c2_g1_i2:42-8018(+)